MYNITCVSFKLRSTYLMEDYMNWTLVLIFVLIFAAMRDVNLFGEERGGGNWIPGGTMGSGIMYGQV